MDLRLDDLTVLITGASGGIGRALAETFAAEGARLALHANSQYDALRGWTAERPWRDRAICVRADVTDPGALAAAFAEAEARFGRIDACVANAGWWPEPDERLDQAPLQRIRDAVRVNLLGAAWTARAWMQGLTRRPPRADGIGASLTFIGSTAGRFGERGHADYAMSKAGLRGLILSLKNEVVDLDPWARVNGVEPGWTATPMAADALARPGAIVGVTRTAPLRQIARAEDIARAVAVLTSPVSRHTTGEVLTIAGGMEGRLRWAEGEIDEAAARARLAPDPDRR